MLSLKSPSLSDLWLAALGSDVGLAVSTNDRRLLREQLYRARSELGDERLEALMISLPDIDNEVWIVQKGCLDAAG